VESFCGSEGFHLRPFANTFRFKLSHALKHIAEKNMGCKKKLYTLSLALVVTSCKFQPFLLPRKNKPKFKNVKFLYLELNMVQLIGNGDSSVVILGMNAPSPHAEAM
jgi:hypothetical protein